jgi:hypothetical protein
VDVVVERTIGRPGIAAPELANQFQCHEDLTDAHRVHQVHPPRERVLRTRDE